MRQDYDSAIHLFPAIEPFDSGFFERDNHQIYFEQTGNPAGKTILSVSYTHLTLPTIYSV